MSEGDSKIEEQEPHSCPINKGTDGVLDSLEEKGGSGILLILGGIKIYHAADHLLIRSPMLLRLLLEEFTSISLRFFLTYYFLSCIFNPSRGKFLSLLGIDFE